MTHLGSLSGNHGSATRRRRKGHRSLFFTLYASELFLSHAYTILLRISLSISIFIPSTIKYISDPTHCSYVRTHLYQSPHRTLPRRREKTAHKLLYPSPTRNPQMNCRRTHYILHVRFRSELIRNSSGDLVYLKTRVLTGLFSALLPVDVTVDAPQRVSVLPQHENKYI